MKTRWYFISALALLVCGLFFLTAGRDTAVAASSQETYQQAPASPAQNSIEHPYTKEDPGPWPAAVAETHSPMVSYEKSGTGLKVTIQIDNHPMDPKKPHYIMWIRLMDDMGMNLGEKTFKATDPAPAIATFELTMVPKTLKAYQQCNIHGIWLNEVTVEDK